MSFDAGSIEASLRIKRDQFDHDIDAATRKGQEFERRGFTAQLRAAFDSQDEKAVQARLDKLVRDRTITIRTKIIADTTGQSSGGAQGGGGGGGGFGVTFRPGGGQGGGTARAAGGGGNQGLGTGLFKGIGPGVLGIGARGSLIAGGIGVGAASLPALVAGLAPLLLAGIGAGVVGGLGAKAVAPASQLVSQQQKAQQALAAATTPAQVKAAQAQLASVHQQLAQLSSPLQSIFHSLAQIQKRWQNFTESLAPMLVGPLHTAAGLLGGVLGPLRQAFAGGTTLISPLLHGLSDLAREVLPLLGQAFRAAAPLLRPLIDGLSHLLGGILRGLIPLLRAAAPAVHALSALFGELGQGIGQMLREFAPVIRASSTILAALGHVLSGLFPIIGQLAGIMARTLAPIFVILARVIRSLEPILIIIGHVFASLAGAILKDLVAAFGALARLIIAIRPAIQTLAGALSDVFDVLENSGVFAIMGNALEQIVPVLAQFINQLVGALAPALPPLIDAAGALAAVLAQLLAAGLTTLLQAITPVVTLLAQFVAGVILFLDHAHLLKPVLLAAAGAWLVLNGVMDANPIGAIILAIVALVGGITLLARHWKEIWGGIKAAAAAAWHFIYDGFGKYLLPLLGPVGLIALGAIELARHWKMVTGLIRTAAHNLWQWLWADFGAKIRDFFTQTIPHWLSMFVSLMRQNLVNPVRQGLTNLRQWIWNDFILKIGNFFTVNLPAAFRRAVSIIGTAWRAVQNAVKTPVNWVIEHVINNGLIHAFDWISSKVGGPHISDIPTLALGGKITRGTHETADDVLVRVSKNETVLSGVHSRMLAPLLGQIGVPGYAAGGKVGAAIGGPGHQKGLGAAGGQPASGLFHDISSFFGKLEDIGKIIAAISTGNIEALTNAFYHLVGIKAPGAAVELAKVLEDIPRTLIKDAVHFLVGNFGASGSIGSGTGAEVARYAARYGTGLSHPYVLGGANPSGWDCSGFTAWVYEHFGYFPGHQGGRFGTSETQWASDLLQASGKQPGALAFFDDHIFPNPGHVGVVLNDSSYVSASSPSVGTIFSNVSAAEGFRIPRGGFRKPGSHTNSAQNMSLARQMYPVWGSGAEWAAWRALGVAESGWNQFAMNASGAYGIPQALPFTKMPKAGWPASAGGHSDPATQIRWMADYIRSISSYQDPIGAMRHERQFGWYDSGGWLPPGVSLNLNATGGPEAVLNPGQSRAFIDLAETARQFAEGGGSHGGGMMRDVHLTLPEGTSVAQALAELKFMLTHAKLAGYVPAGAI